MAEGATIGALRFVLGADVSQLEAATGKASKSLHQAAAAGEAAGAAIGSALTRVGGMIASAFAVERVVSFVAESLRAAAALGRFSDQAGLTVREFEGLSHALRESGLGTEQMAQGFAILSRNLSDLHRNTGPLLDFVRRWAPGLEAQFRAARSTSEAFGVLTDAVNGLGDAQDRVRLAQAALGEQGARLVSSMRQGRSAIEEQARSYQGVGDTGAELARRIQRQWEELSSRISVIAAQIGVAIGSLFVRLNPTNLREVEAEITRLEREWQRLNATGANTQEVLAALNRLWAEQERLTRGVNAQTSGLATTVRGAVDATAAAVGRLNVVDAVRGAAGELALFMARLQFLPTLSNEAAAVFEQAWARQRAVMALNNETASAIEAARLAAIRQFDAERTRILGDSITQEEQYTRRILELQDARAKGLISEAELQRALQRANLSQAAAYVSAVGQGLSAMASAWPKMKAFAIASTIANGLAGAIRAYNDLPTWLAIPVSGMIMAATAKNVADIASTNPGSGVPSVAGGAAGGGGEASGPQQPSQMLTLNLAPGRYSRDEVVGLIEQINEAVSDGAQLVVR